MAENRTPRDNESRAVEARAEHWRPANLLPDPNPQDGYAFRWVRVSMLGKQDPTNVSAKLREGWTPVKASDHPELALYTVTDSNSPFKDNVEVGGLILCKAPKKLLAQRDAFYQHSAQQQAESVDNNFMRENNPKMPLFSEKRSEVKFGSGNK